MTKSRERSFIGLLHFCETVRPIRARASGGDRNEGEPPRQRKTFPNQNPLTQMTTTCNSIVLDRYASLIVTDFIERYYFLNDN